MGIEPTPSAWKAEVLPLNYTRPAPNATELGVRTEQLQSQLRRLSTRDSGLEFPRPAPPTQEVVEGEGFEPS